jgi:GT2 family glycosyltransferase
MTVEQSIPLITTELLTEKKPDISIVIVCWNNKNYLEPCLKSIFTADNISRFEIILVDNGSTDGSQEMMKTQYPEIRLIENGQNVGLCRASNQGIEVTSGRYILLYNNDTLMADHTLDHFVDFMDIHPDAGAVGGRLINPDGTFQSSYFHFPTIWHEILNITRLGVVLNHNFPSNPDINSVFEVDWISSACLGLRRSALDQIGLLDEAYFIYGDEMDLQYRLWKRNWKVYYVPQISTVHYGGVSLNRWRKRKQFYRGEIIYYYKNKGKVKALILRLIFFLGAILKIFFWSLAWLIPKINNRARNEILSNWNILQLCLSSYQHIRDEFLHQAKPA